jgi:hypothetical protein
MWRAFFHVGACGLKFWVVWWWWQMGGPRAGGGLGCCATFHSASRGVTVQSIECSMALQACIIAMVLVRVGVAKWTKRAVSGRVPSVVWVSGSVLEGGDRCYYAIRRHTRCQLMRPSRARPPRRRTVRAAREIWTRLMAYVVFCRREKAFCSTPRIMLNAALFPRVNGKHENVQKW